MGPSAVVYLRMCISVWKRVIMYLGARDLGWVGRCLGGPRGVVSAQSAQSLHPKVGSGNCGSILVGGYPPKESDMATETTTKMTPEEGILTCLGVAQRQTRVVPATLRKGSDPARDRFGTTRGFANRRRRTRSSRPIAEDGGTGNKCQFLLALTRTTALASDVVSRLIGCGVNAHHNSNQINNYSQMGVSPPLGGPPGWEPQKRGLHRGHPETGR